MRCLQEVRWKQQSSRMLGMEQRRYRFWWSGKRDGVDGLSCGERELCWEMEEVSRVSD